MKSGAKPKGADYFLSRVDTSGECWAWLGAVKKGGYGACQMRGQSSAHRVSWLLFRGDIPDDMFVCHSCDNPICVRPEHLFLGDAATNMADKVAKGRQTKGDGTVFRKYPELVRRGEDCGKAKLTEDVVRQIRAEYAAGTVSMYVLADRYGVTRPNIGHIINRKSWAHVA